MSLPTPWLRVQSNGVCLSVKLQPRAASNAIAGPLAGELRVRVTAPPVDSAANEALVRFLADCLHCHPRQIQLTHGHASRHKTILVTGLTYDQILQQLNPSPNS